MLISPRSPLSPCHFSLSLSLSLSLALYLSLPLLLSLPLHLPRSLSLPRSISLPLFPLTLPPSRLLSPFPFRSPSLHAHIRQ